jgi:Glu-tRNA(Gln) amidotransferase subunit E-like FAD-binding protein
VGSRTYKGHEKNKGNDADKHSRRNWKKNCGLMTEKFDYKKLGLRAGLEIHQQLNTQHKLFCNCSTALKEKIPLFSINRKMHPVASELGEIDIAAQFEYLRDRTFNYEVFSNETCLVELDDEPPHNLNREALHIALQIALLFNCQIPEEIQVMRKIVIDGSNTSGFQRTAIVGLNGYIRYKGKRIEITQISLEEDAAAIERSGEATYKLNRLGIPLVEIDTGLLINYNPQEIQEIAYLIGIMCRSTSKTKSGIGSIRQDINISIRRGSRVEVKGVQELGLISKIIENEVSRQLGLNKVVEETRVAKLDGTTDFARPLPGAGRMYPETDIQPMFIAKEYLDSIKENLPEPWSNKLERFKTRLNLSSQLAEEILGSEHLELFERIIKGKKVEPTAVANTFTSVLKDLKRREKIEVDRIPEKGIVEIFDYLERGKIVKEAIPEILKYLAMYPQENVGTAVKELNLRPVSIGELREMTKEVISQPGMNFDKAVGILMSKVRGKIDAQEVIRIVKSMIK